MIRRLLGSIVVLGMAAFRGNPAVTPVVASNDRPALDQDFPLTLHFGSRLRRQIPAGTFRIKQGMRIAAKARVIRKSRAIRVKANQLSRGGVCR